MNAIVIASFVIAGTLLFGVLIAVIVRGFSRAVDAENAAFKTEKASYKPNMTMGHAIPIDAGLEVQLHEARKIAARQAAFLPRGANVGIGQLDDDKQKTSFDGIESDPISAVRMAHFHGWDGLRTGTQVAPPQVVSQAMKGVAEAVPPVRVSGDLIQGKDYPYEEITEAMTPAEKRKARIANAKAKSAAMKAAKTASQPVASPATKTAELSGTAAQAPAPGPVAASAQPIAGVDYEVIEITDAMSPDEVRKARIANAKAKSAANKEFKAAGGASAVSVSEQVEVTEQPVEAATLNVDSTDVAVVTAPSTIPAPNYLEITDGMEKDEIRTARIHNAKEKSAYNKALRAAGIDPKTINK